MEYYENAQNVQVGSSREWKNIHLPVIFTSQYSKMNFCVTYLLVITKIIHFTKKISLVFFPVCMCQAL